MFLSLYACGDIIFAVVGKNRHLRLENDRAAVEFVCHEMYRGTVLLIAVFQRLAMGMQPRIFWQQGRVNVQQTPVVMRDKHRTQNTHKTGQHDHIGRIRVYLANQLAIEGVAAVKPIGSQRLRRNAGFSGAFKAERVGLIAEYCPEGTFNFLRFAGIDNRL